MISFNAVRKTGQLLALLLSLMVLPAFATNTAATVLFSHGTVTVTNAAGGHDLKKGDGVAAGDTIHTGDNGRIQMRFSDGGLVSLRPGSVFAVDKYNQPTDKSEGSLAFNLIKGGLRTLSGTIGHKDHDNYQLKTSVATLGIRGTQFLVTMDGKTMRVHVGHGQISLFNQFGELLVSAGQNGQVTFGNAPELSLIVPDVGGNGSDKSGDQSNGNDSNLTPPDTSLTQTLPSNFIQGEGQSIFASGIAMSWLSYDTDPNNSDADNGVPNSLSISSTTLAQALNYLPAGTSLAGAGNIGAIAENPPQVNKTGDLVWGYVIDNTPSTGPTYMAYALGIPTSDIAANLPVSGVLNYHLAAGSVWNNDTGSTNNITAFDMEVNLNTLSAPTFKVTNLAAADISTFYMDAPVAGAWTGDGNASFKFNGVAGANSSCNGCTLDAAGIFVGQGGAQAGVTFDLTDGDLIKHTGVAALTQTSVPVGGL